MSAFTIRVESDELARVFTNALAFFPARSMVDTALIRVWPEAIEVTATDTYTIGRDHCGTEDFSTGADSFPIEIELDRTGWRDIEAQARKDKGEHGRLDFTPGDCLIFTPGGHKAEKGVAQDRTGDGLSNFVNRDTMESVNMWEVCDELLTLLDNAEPNTPDVITFDLDYLARFRKVKVSKSWDGEKVGCFKYLGPERAMLVKIGPTFLGGIMPINEAKYVAQQGDSGQEGLW